MRSRFVTGALLVHLMAATTALAAGFAYNENLNVLAPDQVLADELLARAEQLRCQVALEWGGKQLPPGAGRVAITLKLTDEEDVGLTWPADRPERKFHWMWLRTSRQRALGSTLHHEMVHSVLATLAPGLPAWCDEGAASLCDDSQRIATCRQALDSARRSGKLPALRPVFDAQVIHPTDVLTYAVTTSVTEYLISRGGKGKLLDFARAGKAKGWDRAAEQYYGVASLRELEAKWRQWLDATPRADARAATTEASVLVGATARR